MTSDANMMPQKIEMMIAAVHEKRLTSMTEVALVSTSMNKIPKMVLSTGCALVIANSLN